MRFWWVNHKLMHSEEIEGGFIWSPKKSKDGRHQETYENLTRTSPEDVVFSYANMKIGYIGLVVDGCEEKSRPPSLDKKGSTWSSSGWYVPINWLKIDTPLKPKEHIGRIAPHLPKKHSPLRSNGNGLQNCYLTEISSELAQILCQLCYAPSKNSDTTQRELANIVQATILNRHGPCNLESKTLIKARRGQGKFKENLKLVEKSCRLSNTKDPRFLIASHIKPWVISNDKEKLDGNNGLLLAPHIDKLFDTGFITFSSEGTLLYSDDTIRSQLKAWGVNPLKNVGSFNPSQSIYLEYHRNEIFRGKLKEGVKARKKNMPENNLEVVGT
ncbi:HNH endonuclease [Microbulbifer sp. TRSA002]|uniref:HNH endonuclease n=1 Tax=Microbulbifer sp. TRSA002 TaxID=3243382 RepID=UPI004039D947